jgi:ribosome-binding protein aMBF1 (putative translation factor)
MSGRKLRESVRRLGERALEGADDLDYRSAYERLGGQIAERRSALGLAQRELADLCGTTQSAIARLESGARAPRLDTLLRVANALDCELAVELRPRTKGGRS